MIDLDTEFGARVARHLREELVVWLTSVSPAGAPLPMPVWFLWDGAESVLVYSMEGARAHNLRANPRVSLNFAGTAQGGDIVVISGEAALGGEPPVDANEAYLEKYAGSIERIGMTPESFAARYSEPVRIRFTRVRGH